MDFPHNHPLVRHLWPLGPDASPADHVDATLRAYQEATGLAVTSPLSREEAKAVRDWLISGEFGSASGGGEVSAERVAADLRR